jgi:hypothetical protein
MAGLRTFNDVAFQLKCSAVIRAGCFNSHNDVDVECACWGGLEAAGARCAEDVSGVSQKSLQDTTVAGADS